MANSEPRWLWLHEYLKAYRGTVSLGLPVDTIRQFGTNEDGTTWIETERSNHVVTESFEEVYRAITAPDWVPSALAPPPEKGPDEENQG